MEVGRQQSPVPEDGHMMVPPLTTVKVLSVLGRDKGYTVKYSPPLYLNTEYEMYCVLGNTLGLESNIERVD